MSAYAPPPVVGPPVHPSTGILRGLPEVNAAPPEVELDGADLAGLSVRAAALRGSDHQWNGDIRQDSCRIATLTTADAQRTVVVAVADGVGSQPRSHLGSRLVCDHLAAELGPDRALELATEPAAADRATVDRAAADRAAAIVADVVGALAASLRALAAADGHDPREYSTTLVGAVLLDPRPESIPVDRPAVVFAVGDSCAYILRHATGAFEPVHDPADPARRAGSAAAVGASTDTGSRAGTGTGSDTGSSDTTVIDTGSSDTGIIGTGIIDTGTEALPGASAVSLYRPILQPGDVLLLCTDGLANPMRHNEALRELLAGYWLDGPPSSTLEFGWQVSARVKSYGDDRAAVGLWTRLA